uniref:Uncharacterized protein n=1 Tax=Panagrolaimus superbus TaxID=310955 RepID=A0A914Z2J9_9BILA
MITFLILIFVGFGNAQLRYRPQEKYDYLTIFKDDQWEKVKCECNAPEFYVSCEDESILQPMLETDYFCFGMTCHYQIIFDPNCPDTYFTVFADYTFQKSKNILSISENPEYGPFFFPSRLIFSPMAKLFVRFDSLNMPHYDHQNKWKITFNPRPAPKKVQINLDLKNPYHLLWIDSMKSDEMITVCLADNNEAQKMEMKLQRRNDLSLIKFYNSNDMTQFVSSLNFEPEMSESTNVFTNSCFTLHQWFKPEPATKSFVLFKLFLVSF